MTFSTKVILVSIKFAIWTSSGLDQMQVHGLQQPPEHLHHVTHSLKPGQEKGKLWLKHLEETSEGVQICKIKNWNLHPKKMETKAFLNLSMKL